ncbi:hypothetical protein DFH28DRAFT_915235 [Melampsora americana]|nr:hypothetical protein DFH28DRAFT_915235 [Melampsora americana]
MLDKRNTIDSVVGSGYETDEAPTAPRRSTRIVTPARRAPGMITPSSDSRRGLGGLAAVLTSSDVRLDTSARAISTRRSLRPPISPADVEVVLEVSK